MKRWIAKTLCAALCLGLCMGGRAGALTVEQARTLLEEYYVDEVPAAALEQESVQGMIDALGDIYTEYWNAEEYEAYMATMEDTSLVGIGVVCSGGEDGLEVIRVIAGGPAEEAGLQAGDVIVAIDGVTLEGLDINEATEYIRGEADTRVSVTFRRGSRRQTVRMVRREVIVPATTGTALPGGIGYIECTTFGAETGGHFKELIAALDDEVNVWVIDLRGNGGGLVDAVGEVASLFTGPGQMVAMRYRNGAYSVVWGREKDLTDKPVVVLVDEESASASEAVSAALRDRAGAVIIGTRTFGKGVAQGVLDENTYPEYFTEGDAMKITMARFFSPLGNTNDTLGVMPDFLVDGQLALEVVKLLAPTWSDETCVEPLLFSLDGQWYTVELDGLEPETQAAAALGAVLDALPRDEALVRNGRFVEVDALYEEFGLTADHWEFADGDTGTVCDGAIYDTLYTYGLVAGKDDGGFHPQDSLTRAELCQLVAVALNCDMPANQSPFSDVAEDAWYAPAVTALSNRGLVKGDGSGRFHPEAEVSHQEFFAVMGRLFAWLNCGVGETLDSVPKGQLALKTLQRYDSWAKAPTWLLSYGMENEDYVPVNLLWDEPEEIDPRAATTRDEAAAVLYQMLRYLTIL